MAELFRPLIPYIPHILIGLLVLGLLRSLFSKEKFKPIGPIECPRCKGSKLMGQLDRKTGRMLKVPCYSCRGIGIVLHYESFKHDKHIECQVCHATGFVKHVEGPKYPDGSPQPGGKVTMKPCGVPDCKNGWIVLKDYVDFRNVIPMLKWQPPKDEPVVPPVAPAPPAKKAPQPSADKPPPAAPPPSGDDEGGDMPPVKAVPSMFGDDPPKGS